MSDTQTSDPEWTELYDRYCDIPIGSARAAVSSTYYKLSVKQPLSERAKAMRQALQQHGFLSGPMVHGAEEYEEIMKGDEIWERIRHV